MIATSAKIIIHVETLLERLSFGFKHFVKIKLKTSEMKSTMVKMISIIQQM